MLTSLSIGTGGLGRFGNQLFTIAGTIGIAIKSGQPFAFPKWVNWDNALFGGKADEMDQYFVNPLPRLPELIFDNYSDYQDHPYFWEYKNVVLPTGNWNIQSHLQSLKYFEHCIDTIRHYFTFHNEPEQNDYVAIHYRAGDYIDDPRAYHPRCSKEYYKEAMKLLPSDNYMVFTDDKKAAFDMFGIMHTVSEHYITDFATMKSCKHFITANSSFSHMAALLGTHPDKKIVMPRRWFGEQANGLSFDSLYPQNAIVI